MDDIIFARQPIYNSKLEVSYYELLYRTCEIQTHAEISNGDEATSHILLNLFSELGHKAVTGNTPAFINVTRNLLLNEVPLIFPTKNFVIEILETMEIDSELIDRVYQLKEKGYHIALDDFVYHTDWTPLIEIADYIKIDVLELSEQEIIYTLDKVKNYKGKLLAEKIESHQMFQKCVKLGFDYFQGYFFCKPNIVTGQKMPANKAIILKLLTQLQKEDASIKSLSSYISQDPILVVKILKILNSALYSLPRNIESISEAIVLIGREQIHKLAQMILLTNVSDKPKELPIVGLHRAKHCELLAKELQNLNPEASFAAGLLSIIDALMDQPLETILENLDLHQDIKNALLYKKGELGVLLNDVISYETGNWDSLTLSNFTMSDYKQKYLEMLSWTDEIFAQLN